jgi:hypothetical protein
MITRVWLRSPAGQLSLVAVTFAVAVVIAVVMAVNRGFFEKYIREKYPEPSAATISLLEKLEPGDTGNQEDVLIGQNLQVLESLYQAWMWNQDEEKYRHAPRVLTQMYPAYFKQRIERTLAGGNLEQKGKALEFIRLSDHQAFIPTLSWALQHFANTPAGVLIDEIESTLAALSESNRESTGAWMLRMNSNCIRANWRMA